MMVTVYHGKMKIEYCFAIYYFANGNNTIIHLIVCDDDDQPIFVRLFNSSIATHLPQ